MFLVSGAKGGVGTTFVASNLAVYMANTGRQVVVANLRYSSAPIAPLFGLRTQLQQGEACEWLSDSLPFVIRPTGIAGLELCESVGEGRNNNHSVERQAQDPAAVVTSALDRLQQRGSTVVVDAGSLSDGWVAQLWRKAQGSVFVTTPDPVAIAQTYRSVAAFFRAACLGPEVDEERSLYQGLSWTASGIKVERDLAKTMGLNLTEGTAWARFRTYRKHFRFPIIVNQTRMRADALLGEQVRSVVWRKFGLSIECLGFLEFDDAIWMTTRQAKPLMLASPSSRAAKVIERTARDLLSSRKLIDGPPSGLAPRDSYFDLLEVERGATDDDIRRASKRMKSLYGQGSPLVAELFSAQELSSLQDKLQEATDVLLDHGRRRPYELSLFPDVPQSAAQHKQILSPRTLPAPPPIDDHTEYTGELLRQVRLSQGISLREISDVTKIAQSHLSAIEQESFADFSALVYLQGFVRQLAQFLKLDAEQASKSYCGRYRDIFKSAPAKKRVLTNVG